MISEKEKYEKVYEKKYDFCAGSSVMVVDRIEIVMPRPGKGRHVTIAACPQVGPSFPGSIQGLARLMISTRYSPNIPLKKKTINYAIHFPKFR